MELFPVIDISEIMQEKFFQEPLFTTLGENLVATWKFWLLFQWLSLVGSKKYKNLQESTKEY